MAGAGWKDISELAALRAPIRPRSGIPHPAEGRSALPCLLVRVLRICHAIYRPVHVCLAGGTGIRLGHLLDPLKRATEVELDNDRGERISEAVRRRQRFFHAAPPKGRARIAGKRAVAGVTRPRF